MIRIIQGNALQIPLADQSVHCVVTSPPYWGLRDYGVAGQLGLEPTFDEYLTNMLRVFNEVHRVLRDDGTLWLNMGDGYAGSGKGLNGDGSQGVLQSDKQRSNVGASGTIKTPVAPGLKPKDLIGQPWALAFALRAAGWYLRGDIIWHKPAPMPESVSDRPTKAHEYLFLLTKRPTYFFDQAAWLEPASMESAARLQRAHSGYNPPGQTAQGGICAARPNAKADKQRGHSRRHAGFNDRWDKMERAEQCSGKRNRRSVWTIAPQPTPEAHFATFPEALVEPCLLAGCPQYTCPTCGQGWEPIEEKTRSFESGSGKSGNAPVGKNGADMQGGGETLDVRRGPTLTREIKGYAPACKCGEISNVPGTAFDPFSGSGTVCAVANRMGYNGIGLELNPAYIEIAKRRIFADVTPTPEEKAKGQRMVFA